MQVLLNVFADEIHRAHQRCSLEAECNPHRDIQKLVLDAGERLMALLQGAYSCICLVKGVGLVAFRDPHGIRCNLPPAYPSHSVDCCPPLSSMERIVPREGVGIFRYGCSRVAG